LSNAGRVFPKKTQSQQQKKLSEMQVGRIQDMGRLHHSRGVEQSHKSRQVEGVLWNDTTLDEEKPELKMIWKSRNGLVWERKYRGRRQVYVSLHHWTGDSTLDIQESQTTSQGWHARRGIPFKEVEKILDCPIGVPRTQMKLSGA
jgi:hypothetical protein